jgi:hypothetical protein
LAARIFSAKRSSSRLRTAGALPDQRASSKAARALAYARIYAESNEALREKVDSIWLARSTTPSGRPVEVAPPAKRRGRPPKIAAVETLPGVEARSAS